METITTAVAEYSKTEAALAELRQIVANAKFDVATKEGMAGARKLRHQLRTLRTTLEATRVECKKPILHQARVLDYEAARITKEIVALEDPLDAQISAVEKAEEAKRQAAEQANRERISAIEKLIADMDKLPYTMVGKSASDIAAALDALRGDNPEEWAQELLPKATLTHRDTIDALEKMVDVAAKAEAEAKRLAVERAELDRRQAEQRAAEEKARQEREEAERQSKARIAAEEDAAHQRLAEERARIQAQEDQARKQRQAEEDRLRAERQAIEDEKRRAQEEAEAKAKAERDRLEAEQRAKDEKARRQREAEEAKAAAARREQEERERQEREAAAERAREILRKENELLDGRQMLKTFDARFGHREEFGSVVVAIRTYLEKKAA